MKTTRFGYAVCIAAALCSFNASLLAQPVVPPRPPLPAVTPTLPRIGGTEFTPDQVTLTSKLSSDLKPMPVLAAMQRVADWELAHPSFATNRPATGWVQAAGNAGMMALAGISGDAKYRDAMLALGETNDWKLGRRMYDADDHCIGQTWAELYFLYRAPKMIVPLRERFDSILANPSASTTLEYKKKEDPKVRENWAWCDSLFMGPPTWVRLYAATGDEKYLTFAVTNWRRTTDYLYDKDEHLFFRDSTFFDKKEANGKKVFWGRGNGWVMAGLVRVLQYLPMNGVAATPPSQKGAGDASSSLAPRDEGVAHTLGDGASPPRARFEQLFKDMAAKILTCQQPDGLWRASLLDPDSYPLKETSGSGFYTYALAWGVNQSLLDRSQFEPAVRKAWAALVGCVDADGKLTHVQPIGADPKKFAEDSTEVYGVGAFLLAGSEVYRMAVLSSGKLYVGSPILDDFPLLNSSLSFKVENLASVQRESESVEINLGQTIAKLHPISSSENSSFDNARAEKYISKHRFSVMDGVSSRVLDSQIYLEDGNTKLLFQVDLAPGETRTFYILDAAALAAVPPPIVKTMARYVPERYDDFAWESDRIAHRIYGQALIKAEGTVSSGADVWIKKDRGLIVDTMYATKHYHEDNGSFMDDYRVGKSRGCGGLGIWDGKQLHVSSNWKNCKLITTGPIRSEFELTYDAWDAGNGRMVSEVKRFSIDAGSWLTKVTSTISGEDKSPLIIGVGLAERACPTNREEFIAHDQTEGWMTYWQPEDRPKGITAVAILLPKDSVKEFTNDNPTMPDSVKHANVAEPTHEGYPPIRTQMAVTQFGVDKPFSYYFGACWDRSGDFTNHVQWENYLKRFAERRDQPLQVTVGN